MWLATVKMIGIPRFQDLLPLPDRNLYTSLQNETAFFTFMGINRSPGIGTKRIVLPQNLERSPTGWRPHLPEHHTVLLKRQQFIRPIEEFLITLRDKAEKLAKRYRVNMFSIIRRFLYRFQL